MIRLGLPSALILVLLVTLVAGTSRGIDPDAAGDNCMVAAACEGGHAVSAVCGSACGHGFHVAVSQGLVIVVAAGSLTMLIASTIGRHGRLVPTVLDRPPRLFV